MPARIEIDVTGRWNALALSQRLAPYHAYLVQFGPERWHVHAEAPGYHGERLPDALAVVEDCLLERRVEDALVRVDGRLCSLPAPRSELEPSTVLPASTARPRTKPPLIASDGKRAPEPGAERRDRWNETRIGTT